MFRLITLAAVIILACLPRTPLTAQDDTPPVFVYDVWLLTEDGHNGTVYATLENTGDADVTLNSVTSPDGEVMLTPMDAAPPTILAGEALYLTPDSVGFYVSSNGDEPTLDDGLTLTLTFTSADDTTYIIIAAALPADAPPDEQPVVVLASWARPTALDADSGGDPAAVISGAYLTLENRSEDADALVAVSSPGVAAVEIHEMQMDDGIMRMRPMASLPLDAGARHALAPGGDHLMLIGLERHLLPGAVVPLTLTFESGLEITTAVPVRDERDVEVHDDDMHHDMSDHDNHAGHDEHDAHDDHEEHSEHDAHGGH